MVTDALGLRIRDTVTRQIPGLCLCGVLYPVLENPGLSRICGEAYVYA
jgi:hypothetical protein